MPLLLADDLEERRAQVAELIQRDPRSAVWLAREIFRRLPTVGLSAEADRVYAELATPDDTVERPRATRASPAAPPRTLGARREFGVPFVPPRRSELCAQCEKLPQKYPDAMKACPVGLAGLVVAVRETGASFFHGIFDGGRRVHDACACAAARGQHRLDGVLPGLPRRCAARSAEAAHAAASSSYEPPRKPWRGPCALYWIQYCFRCMSFAAWFMVSVFCLWTRVQVCLWRRAP